MRLKLVPTETNFNFFGRWKLWLGISLVFTLIILRVLRVPKGATI